MINSLIPCGLVLVACAGFAFAGDAPTSQAERRAREPAQTRLLRLEPGVRVMIDAPRELASRVELILYALPNGNTIEWTAGKRVSEGDDWHFGIQHIAAQTARLREVMDDRSIAVAYLEAEGKSWPGWKQKHPDYPKLIPGIVTRLVTELPEAKLSLHLSGHSGGGSFIFGYIDGAEAIPPRVNRISFLDSNYAYSDERKHGDKLLAWLRADKAHCLAIICYDDRHITLNGKPVLKTPLGGTWGSTHRMMDRLGKDVDIKPVKADGYERYQGLDGQVDIIIHPNPQNKILHTELVRLNGLIHVVTAHTPHEGKAGLFSGPIAYESWIEKK